MRVQVSDAEPEACLVQVSLPLVHRAGRVLIMVFLRWGHV
jgi:hypothetical protein